MRRLAAGIALAGLVAIAVAGVSLRDRLAPPQPQPPAEPASLEVVEPESVAPALPPVVSRVRPVAPEVVAAPPVDYHALERVEARGPLSDIGVARSPSEGPPKETILFRPLATGGGSFLSQGYHVELSGIAPTGADETCISDGVSWPCGIHARTAFRNWLRGRALTCVVPPVPTGETVVTECFLGRQNPAEWLVAHGWARAVPEGPYAALEAKASEARLGLYGPAPVVPEPSPVGTETGSVAADPAPVSSGTVPFVSEPLSDGPGLSGG